MSLLAGLSQQGDSINYHNSDSAAHSALFAAVGAPLIFYVDSSNGNDSASGISPDLALKSIAAASGKLADGVTLRLRCGSMWREMLDTSIFDRVTIETYGAGTKPLFDCSDVIASGWSKTAGRTYVYQVTVTHALTSTARIRVWEESARLTRAASVADCDATEGSFYSDAPSGTSATIYVHATGGGNPASNGKNYEFSPRMYGVRIGNLSIARGIHTTRNGAEDGSLVSLGFSGTLFEDCLATDGSKHNVSIGDGICRSVTAHDCETREGVGQASLFVAYIDDPTGKRAVFDKCRAMMPRYGSWCVGFIAHGVANPFDSVLYQDCEAQWLSSVFGGEALALIISGGESFGCSHLFDAGFSTGGETYIAGHFFSNADESWGVAGSQIIRGYSPKITVRNCEIVTRTSADSMIWPRTSGCALTVENNTLVFPANASGYPQSGVHVTSGTAIIRNNVIAGGTHAILSYSGVTLTEDQNVFGTSQGFIYNGTEYGDFAAYRVASGQGANSQQVDPKPSLVGSDRIVWLAGSPVLTAKAGARRYTDPKTAQMLATLGY